MIFIGNITVKMKDDTLFLDYLGKNYENVKTKLKMLCGRNGQQFSEDFYHEAIIRCTKAIQKKGKLNDTSPYGIESYLIKSYMNLPREEARSCKNSKRDNNYNSDNIQELYNEYYNKNNDTSTNKVAGDLYLDFSTLYIVMAVEKNFPPEDLYLFKLKYICSMTYKDIAARTKIKGARQRILFVKQWVQNNITKEQIKSAFSERFDDILPE